MVLFADTARKKNDLFFLFRQRIIDFKSVFKKAAQGALIVGKNLCPQTDITPYFPCKLTYTSDQFSAHTAFGKIC